MVIQETKDQPVLKACRGLRAILDPKGHKVFLAQQEITDNRVSKDRLVVLVYLATQVQRVLPDSRGHVEIRGLLDKQDHRVLQDLRVYRV